MFVYMINYVNYANMSQVSSGRYLFVTRYPQDGQTVIIYVQANNDWLIVNIVNLVTVIVI